MTGLSSPGIGSGLDVTSLVSQLVAAERTPQQNQINARSANLSSQLSALGSLKSALSSLNSSISSLASGKAFSKVTTTSSDTDVLSATSSSGAVASSFQIDVQQLAQAQKRNSDAYAADDSIGSGTLHLTVGDTTLDIDVGDGSDTLAKIRDAINKAGDANPGVTATLVNGSDGTRLALSSKDTGLANAFTVTADGDAALGAFADSLNTAGEHEAQDALITLDGIDVSSASNTVTDAVDGLTLNLAATGTSQVAVKADTASAGAAINAFVTAYNKYVGVSSQLSVYNTDPTKSGALIGDATLRTVDNGLSNVIGSVVGGDGLKLLSDIGITLKGGDGVTSDGTLVVDDSKLTKALTTNRDGVARLFGGDDGYATRMGSLLDGYLDDGGALDSRIQSLNDRTSELDDRQAALDARMESVQARYTKQFTALDAMLAKMQSTTDFLTSALAGLIQPGDNINSN